MFNPIELTVSARSTSVKHASTVLNKYHFREIALRNGEKKRKRKKETEKAGYAILANPKEKRPTSPVNLLAKDGEIQKKSGQYG